MSVSERLMVRPDLSIDDLADFIDNTEEEYSPLEDTSMYEDAFCYQPTKYVHLREIADYLGMKKDDVFVDYGCGKGRVVCFMALQNIRKVVGVELRKEIADIADYNARRLLRAYRPDTEIEIHNEDSASFYTEEGTVFYLFNPFGKGTVESVLTNIRDSVIATPREVRIVYNNTVYSECLNCSDWLAREGQVGETGIWVWRSRMKAGRRQ